MLDDRIKDPNEESASDPPEGSGSGGGVEMALDGLPGAAEDSAASDPPEGSGSGGGGL